MLEGWCVLLSLIAAAADDCLGSPSVMLRQGRLLGSWTKTRGGRRVAAFKGIPYARPPVDQLRFRSPQPPDPWPGTRPAQLSGPSCVQHMSQLDMVVGEEDCLHLNIFTPDVQGSLPVLFFIHGGYYKHGSDNSLLYGPKYWLDQDIVLVTINYRLGVLGFLSMEDPALPGNLGLKDQRAALRWVRDNIAQFGGDPNRVTVFGESAGAKSAHLHILFNSDEGLFRAGILHSGSAFTPAAFKRPGEQRALVDHLLNQTSCAADDKSAAVDCLRTVDAHKLTRISLDFSLAAASTLMRRVELAPVVEPECVEDSFITGDPWDRTSDLPLIVGSNQLEGLFPLVNSGFLKDKSGRIFEEFNRNADNILPFNFIYDKSAEDPGKVTERLKSFYLQDQPVTEENFLQLVDMNSDAFYKFGASEAMRHNLNKTYLYSFEYLGSRSILTAFGFENFLGPTHVDDLLMFFPFSLIPTHNRNINKTAEVELSSQMVKMWTNFVTYLDPTPSGSSPEWAPASSQDPQYLDIRGPDNFTMQPDFLKTRMDFWRNLPFRNKPITGVPICKQ